MPPALIVFDGQQAVRPVLLHQVPGGFGLGVQCVQRDEPAFQLQLREEL